MTKGISYLFWLLGCFNLSSVVISFRSHNWSVFMTAVLAEILIAASAIAFNRYL